MLLKTTKILTQSDLKDDHSYLCGYLFSAKDKEPKIIWDICLCINSQLYWNDEYSGRGGKVNFSDCCIVTELPSKLD